MSKVKPMNNQQLSKTEDDDILQTGLVCLSRALCLACFPFGKFTWKFLKFIKLSAICGSYKIVSQYERAVKFRLGKLEGGPQGPGNFWILPCTDEFVRVDTREISFDIPVRVDD